MPDPSFERADDRASRRDALWIVTQQLHELTSDVARNAEKTDRLIADVAKLGADVGQMKQALTLGKGFGIAVVLLIPACAGLIWWLVGEKIDALRDQIYQAPFVRPAPVTQPTSPHP